MQMNIYQEQARETAMYPQEHTIVYPALGLCGEAGEVADIIKKLIRDDGGIENMNEETARRLEKELGDVMWYLANLAYDLNVSLDFIAEENIKKLRDRKSRNVIKGSGDDR